MEIRLLQVQPKAAGFPRFISLPGGLVGISHSSGDNNRAVNYMCPQISTDRRTFISLAQPEIATRFAALNPPKRYLFVPGPTMVHPRVYEALSQPIVGHLDPYFIRSWKTSRTLLKPVFGLPGRH